MQAAFFLLADGPHSLAPEPSTPESVLGMLATGTTIWLLIRALLVEAAPSREALIRARSKDQGRKDHKHWQQRQGEVHGESGNH
jgi:hypothetical protein